MAEGGSVRVGVGQAREERGRGKAQGGRERRRGGGGGKRRLLST